MRQAPLDTAYLAGLFDGEGSVGYFSQGVGRTLIFTMEMKMTDENVIDWVVAVFGGNKTFRKRGEKHHKDQWRWKVTGAAATKLYTKLLPFLRIKNTFSDVTVSIKR